MPAIVRVKRRIDEEPLSAFVLNSKKRRRLDEIENATECSSTSTDAADKEEISTILKFAGTINEQDDTVTTQMARLTKEAAKELVQQRTRRMPTNLTERHRQETRQAAHEQRFRVVNFMRTSVASPEATTATPSSSDSASSSAAAIDAFNANKATGTASQVTIVDIEKQSPTTATPTQMSTNTQVATSQSATTNAATPIADAMLMQPSDSDTGYVYDLYLPENEQQAAVVDEMDDNYLSVHATGDFLIDERYNNESDDDSNGYDSEDSNQENYFMNDYPEEDDEQDDDRDEHDEEFYNMRNALERFVFDEDNDDDDDENEHDEFHDNEDGTCSSGDEDYNTFHDPYVHTREFSDDTSDYSEDLNYCDVEMHGSAYAHYKARIMRELQQTERRRIGAGDDSESDRYQSASENEEGKEEN